VTADAEVPVAAGAPAATGTRVDLFLLAGQFPAADHRDTLSRAVSYARAAETAGFDGVWLAEHHFISYGVCPSAVTLAGYVLGRTTRVEVGTAAAILSNRHPVALAEEAALLDAVSGGRFRLGVARGGPWVDLEVFGSGLDRFTDGFAESLDLLLATLSGEATVRADGRFFRFREVPVVPRPDGPLPVWVAATSAPRRRCGHRFPDGWRARASTCGWTASAAGATWTRTSRSCSRSTRSAHPGAAWSG
jgi:alkanesulfonate monooxygenase SsuD/methylene tetrahydromethanopterin reductase-like flavin-dependent oxidoreductase (luciferase family)